MSDGDCKYFVKCFLNFLRKQINERNFNSDIVESIEVATQCLEAAYDLPANDAADGEATSSANTSAAGSATASGTTTNRPDFDLFEMFRTACIDVLPDQKERAEEVKNEGNRLMKDNKFNEALVAYTKAIALDATNATFYCNRAAAYIRLNEYEKSIADCKMALRYNPAYSKAYGRMGIAYTNLQKFEEACAAYKKAIELEPSNQDYKNNLHITEHQIRTVEQQIVDQITIENPGLRDILIEMISDPMITNASREVASQMANEFPDVFTEFRSQIAHYLTTPGAAVQLAQQMQLGGSGGVGGTGGAPASGRRTQIPEPQQPPPPPPPNNEDGGNTSR